MKTKILNMLIQALLLYSALYFYREIPTRNLKISWILIYVAIAVGVWAIANLLSSPPTNPNYDDDEDIEEEGPPIIPPEFSRRKIHEDIEEPVY